MWGRMYEKYEQIGRNGFRPICKVSADGEGNLYKIFGRLGDSLVILTRSVTLMRDAGYDQT